MRALGLASSLALLVGAPLAAQSQGFRIGDIVQSTKEQQAQQAQRSQRDGRDSRAKIPPGQLPPAGMCRIWIDGVPPGQQPAPTDCQTAVANKPANARVIWGDQTAFPGKGKGKFKSQKDKNGDVEKQNGRGRGHGNDDGDDDDDDNGSVSSRRNGSMGGSLPTTSTRDLSRKSKKGKGHGGD